MPSDPLITGYLVNIAQKTKGPLKKIITLERPIVSQGLNEDEQNPLVYY